MSRIGKKPISIPQGVEVKIEGRKVITKGPKGELSFDLPSGIQFEIKDSNPPATLPSIGRAPAKIFLSPLEKTKKLFALWGTIRAIIAANIKGITEGYEKKLEIEGLGYRAQVEGGNLVLNVGFTHPVKIEVPERIKISVDKNIIIVSGIDKQLVSQIAAKIKKVKEPDPYKAKGIKYSGEVIKKKAGKKVVATTK